MANDHDLTKEPEALEDEHGRPRSKLRKAFTVTRDVLFPAWHLGIAPTVRLMASETRRTVALGRSVGASMGDAAAAIRRAFSKPKPDADEGVPFEEQLRGLRGDQVRWNRVYRHFLSRKRVSVAMAAFFMALGVYGVINGAVLGLLPGLLGGGLALEFAWLAEFRLWQLRTPFAEGELATLKAFAGIRGAWRGVLNVEPGAGLAASARVYLRWLCLKRLGLSAFYAGIAGAAATALGHTQCLRVALVGAGLGLVLALLVEARLIALRAATGHARSIFAALSFERLSASRENAK